MIAWVTLILGSDCSTMGIPKANVFPDPVLACPTTSWPSCKIGMVASWIGVGALMPILAIDVLVEGMRLIEGKTSVCASSISFENLGDCNTFCLRSVKQSEQYRFFPGIGMNGTSAVPPQAVQSAL